MTQRIGLQPYRVEQQLRNQERMARAASMPTDLGGLLRWFEAEWRMEIPTALHSAGVEPQSELGAPPYADGFRRRLYNPPSEVDERFPDEDGRKPYIRPIAAALGRMGRNGKPLTAKILMRIGSAGFDWRAVAIGAAWPFEMFELWLKEALILLWRDYREWTRLD